MLNTLFPFQEDKLLELKSKIINARTLIDCGESQVISFSAPTGAGKTIIMTALFEDILFGTDDFESQPDSVIIWLSDMPDLNEQTRLKIESKSDRIKASQLINIDSNYDSEVFEGGNIFFLNTQKLGNDKLLTQKSDSRQFTIWETLTNTARMNPKKLYIVIDEAHRGMYSSVHAENEAQSIMQKFLFGSACDGLCKMPLVIGITATPQRFQKLLDNTTSTVYNVIIKPEEVRDSGLLKDRVIIHYPDIAINADLTMFKGAIESWINSKKRWKEYCEKEKEGIVNPILVIQVEDGNNHKYTHTDIGACIVMIEQLLGREIKYGEIVHTFNERNVINVNGVDIQYIEPSRIEENQEIKFVFFKMNLSTGWDCPRAEVMMSFRSAQDYTYIAQLLGRMVRAPLARRIKSNAELNDVNLFLPYYDEETVKSVINALKNEEEIPPSETGTSKELISLNRNPEFKDIFKSMDNLITYKIETVRKQQPLKLLSALSRAITQDGISTGIYRSIQQKIINKMEEEILRIKSNGNFEEKVKDIIGFNMNILEFDFDDNSYIKKSVNDLKATKFDIDNLFKKAGRVLGDGINVEYWKKNISRDEIEVKVEVIVLVNDFDAMKLINEFASNEFNELYQINVRNISKLNEARRDVYDKLLLSSDNPIAVTWQLPDKISYSIDDKAKIYEKHLFIEDNGSFRVSMNTWESDILSEELKRGAVAWLRNIERKQWSLQIPYIKAGVFTSMFPDLIIVRKDKDGYIFDILEPHDQSRSDNYEKAKGLAKFAEEHWRVFGRVQLIRKMKSHNGNEYYYRLDMSKVSIRNKVRSIIDNHALDILFESDGIIE